MLVLILLIGRILSKGKRNYTEIHREAAEIRRGIINLCGSLLLCGSLCPNYLSLAVEEHVG